MFVCSFVCSSVANTYWRRRGIIASIIGAALACLLRLAVGGVGCTPVTVRRWRAVRRCFERCGAAARDVWCTHQSWSSLRDSTPDWSWVVTSTRPTAAVNGHYVGGFSTIFLVVCWRCNVSNKCRLPALLDTSPQFARVLSVKSVHVHRPATQSSPHIIVQLSTLTHVTAPVRRWAAKFVLIGN